MRKTPYPNQVGDKQFAIRHAYRTQTPVAFGQNKRAAMSVSTDQVAGIENYRGLCPISVTDGKLCVSYLIRVGRFAHSRAIKSRPLRLGFPSERHAVCIEMFVLRSVGKCVKLQNKSYQLYHETQLALGLKARNVISRLFTKCSSSPFVLVL